MFYKIFDILTIGLPFGVFKITTGLYYGFNIIMWWGFLDIFINTLNFIFYLIQGKKRLPSCFLALCGNKLGNLFKINNVLTEDTGESLDVLFAFIIVAWIIGSGAIVNYPQDMLRLWNISVVLNVLGAGSSRVFQSIRRYKN